MKTFKKFMTEKVKPKDVSGLSASTIAKRKKAWDEARERDPKHPESFKPSPGDKGAKTKTSQHTKDFRRKFGEELETIEVTDDEISKFLMEGADDYLFEDQGTETALKNKAEKTGFPLSVIRAIFNKGRSAWRTSHRPGTNPDQWGFARVNAVLSKNGKARKVDQKLYDRGKKAKDKKKKAKK